MEISQKRRIWGWMFFDWAQQPFYTLGLTFVFGPYFAYVATELFVSQGEALTEAKAHSQWLWSLGQTISGVIIALSAPLLGAIADRSGRKMPWIIFFSVAYVVASALLWGLTPDGANLVLMLVIFYVGFVAAESGLNFVNAYLPSMGTDEEIGRVSGSGSAFGYWGGVVSLFIMLLLLAENENGVTLLGTAPLFGLDPDLREGTRSVGPFIAIWYLVFMIPFFLWVRDVPKPAGSQVASKGVVPELVTSIRAIFRRKSLGSFLLGSMLYRDALNALYAFGGVYAALVLDWSIIQIGVFGIVAAIAAAIVTWAGGLLDQRTGPKPVIRVAVWALIVVCIIIVGMSRESLLGIPLAEGSAIPDIIFYLCGAVIGGAGGSLYASSRSLMVRHLDPARPTEAFGLFALTGKATAFLAPGLITIFTAATGSNQKGFIPVIILFILGLWILRWVNPDGEKGSWAEAE